MFCRLYTVAFLGVEAREVSVEVMVSSGLPAFQIVGLPDKAVGESRDRIKASFQRLGLGFPAKRITVNLAPADLQKEGSHYDVPIALGLMGALGILDPVELEEYLALGELSLDGKISRVNGVLPSALLAIQNKHHLICPFDSGAEAAWAGDLKILPAPDLMAILKHFKGERPLKPPRAELSKGISNSSDFADVKGQEFAKRGLEIAAAGGHHVLLIGPPGVGKSMLAKRFSSILPPLTPQEALDVTIVHSLSGMLPKEGLVCERPYRDPHHSASLVALVGGGHKTKPGEISLSHHGVLFLDELPEFSRATLESLRQPLESGSITIARANSHVTYPARIQLIGAMNPCRCGFFFDSMRQCSKAPQCAGDYQKKISGPLLDRFDLVVSVEEVNPLELLDYPRGESSILIKERVVSARQSQLERAGELNAQIDGKELHEAVSLNPTCVKILRHAIDKYRLSARGYHRVLRVSRTIADLEKAPYVGKAHILEALTYRRV